eukprot:2890289-Rhodomonas_salina.1
MVAGARQCCCSSPTPSTSMCGTTPAAPSSAPLSVPTSRSSPLIPTARWSFPGPSPRSDPSPAASQPSASQPCVTAFQTLLMTAVALSSIMMMLLLCSLGSADAGAVRSGRVLGRRSEALGAALCRRLAVRHQPCHHRPRQDAAGSRVESAAPRPGWGRCSAACNQDQGSAAGTIPPT